MAELAPEIYSSRDSTVTVDGKSIDGIQSIEWKVNRQRSDVLGTGQNLRLGVEFGVKQISGSIKVKSSISALDEKIVKDNLEEAVFQLIVELKKLGGVEPSHGGDGKGGFKFTFDGCYVDTHERSMDVNGVPVSIYTFTATDVKEE
jgi:hypothetical protein